MRLRILGCGSAGGVPSLSRGWGLCDPNNPKNRRLRQSVLIETDQTKVLVDTSPDLRQQLLDCDVKRLDGVIFTHEHADHLHGIDDLREINRAMSAAIPIFAFPETLQSLSQRFAYVMGTVKEGQSIYKPMLIPSAIEASFQIGNIVFQPITQDHGTCRSMGLRFGGFAYSTDLVNLDNRAFDQLAGIDTWVVSCLMLQPHPTHAHLDKVLSWIDRIKPRRTFLTHMTPLLDYQTLKDRLPVGVEPAYDGLVLLES